MANGTKMRKPFNRLLVLEKLSKHGIKAVTIPGPSNTPVLSHLEARESAHIGLKLWGYIDSLDSQLRRI